MSNSGARSRAARRYLNAVATSLRVDEDTARNLIKLDHEEFVEACKEYNSFWRRLKRALLVFHQTYPWYDAFDRDPIEAYDPPPQRHEFVPSKELPSV